LRHMPEKASLRSTARAACHPEVLRRISGAERFPDFEIRRSTSG
jgi:hypothetical protein